MGASVIEIEGVVIDAPSNYPGMSHIDPNCEQCPKSPVALCGYKFGSDSKSGVPWQELLTPDMCVVCIDLANHDHYCHHCKGRVS